MKKSISYWSFAGGLDGTKKLGECFSEAKAFGFDAVELCCREKGELNLKATEKQCAAIRARAEKAGIEIASLASGIYWDYNLGCKRVTERNKAELAAKKMLHIAQWLGVDALLFIPGAVDVFFNPAAEVVPYDVLFARIKRGMKRLVRVAEECGVALCLENVWNKFLLSPLEMRDFIDCFESDCVGSYFDVGNALLTGYPEHWIHILGKRIKRVHFKDFKTAVGTADGFCDLLEGDVHWNEVMKALKKAGYSGYCTAEMIPTYTLAPDVHIRNTSIAMDAILKM